MLNNDVTDDVDPSSPAWPASSELTPKTLVLDVLAVAGNTPLTSTALAAGGELMGFTPGAVRVAISRLAAEGLIESPGRGEWMLAPTAPWAREQARWQHLEALVRPWTGAWWLVISNQVPRSNRALWRRHERALLQRGFREVQRDVFIRPANLALTFDVLWDELAGLGMHPKSLLLTATDISLHPAPAHWNCEQRHQALTRVLETMQAVLRERTSADPDDLCRRFLLVGREAARVLNTDPLLPDDWAGPSHRQEVAAAMPRFVAAGRALWLKRLGVS